VPIEEVMPKRVRERRKIIVSKQIVETAKELKGTLEAVLFDREMRPIKRLPVSELAEKLQKIKGVDTVVFDGVVTKRLVDIADEKNIKHLVAARISNKVKQPFNVSLLTFTDIEG
jgi:DNA primase